MRRRLQAFRTQDADARVLPSPHGRLPRIGRDDAEARNRVLGALAGLPVDDGEDRLRLAPRAGSGRTGAWLQFTTARGAVAMAPDVFAGAPVLWTREAQAPAIPEALVEMSRFEFLIAALERSSGLAFDPAGLGPAPDLRVQLDLVGPTGEVRHRAWLALDPAVGAGWPARRLEAEPSAALARARADLCLTAEAGAAPRDELGLLEPGDIVLMPSLEGEGWPAILHAGPTTSIGLAGLYRPACRDFRFQRWETAPMSTSDLSPSVVLPPNEAAWAISLPPEPGPGPLAEISRDEALERPAAATGPRAWVPPDLPVRLQLVIAQLQVPFGELGGLAPGCVIAVPSAGAELQVALTADSVPLATGRLVALGDGYGVLVDRLGGD